MEDWILLNRFSSTDLRFAVWPTPWLKDKLEDVSTKNDDEIPHHITEFDRVDLNQALQHYFIKKAEQVYSLGFTTPRRLFLTLVPKR